MIYYLQLVPKGGIIMDREPKHFKDSHAHTSSSHDGKSMIEEYLAVAAERGVDEITFTDHYDIYDGVKSRLQTLDIDRCYLSYLGQTAGVDLATHFGIEIGLRPEVEKQIKDMVKEHREFDFIIGSSHITCGKDMSMDPSFFAGYTRNQAYTRYFEEVLENIRMCDDEFDVYGHLDYVVRYGGYASKIIDYTEFKNVLDQILATLIKKGKGIEINTSGIRYGLASPHPNKEILARYRELGGRIITIGSDAHCVDHLAGDFDVAYQMAKEAGFNEVAVFEKREPRFVRI